MQNNNSINLQPDKRLGENTNNFIFTLYDHHQCRKVCKGHQVTAADIFRIVTSDPVLKATTEKLRKFRLEDSNLYRQRKRYLPALVCSTNGHCGRDQLLKGKAKWNGLISLDLDLVKNGKSLMTREDALSRIKNCPSVYMALPSVSNEGFGLFVRLNVMPNCPEAERAIFEQINLTYFDGKLDPGRKDISGCRFLAYCPPEDFYVNPNAEIFEEQYFPNLTEHALSRQLYPVMALFDDAHDASVKLEKGEWRSDGLYDPKAIKAPETPEQKAAKLAAAKAKLPQYSYMGQPYGKLLLTRKAPKKEYTVRNPDINPNITTLLNHCHKPASCPVNSNPVPDTSVNSASGRNLPNLVAPSYHTKLYQIPVFEIQPGQRNSYLTSTKGFLSYSGLSNSQCAVKLLEINKKFSHPLPEEEVNRITYYPNSNLRILTNNSTSISDSSSVPDSSREYTVDTQRQLDFTTAWNLWTKTKKRIIKTGNPNDVLSTIDIAYAFAEDHPEWEILFKSFHAFTCAIGRKFAFERYTWEDDPDGTEWRIILKNDAYLNLNPQEIRHAEINQTRTVVKKESHVHSLDSDKVNVKTQDSYNRAYVGYKLVEVDSMTLSELITLMVFLEGDRWNVTNKYVGDESCFDAVTTTPQPHKVLSILMKCRTVDRRNEWYLAKLRKQWDESAILVYLPELLAAENA